MAESYREYRRALTDEGTTRRTRDQLRVAGINAQFASIAPLLAPFQEFDVPKPRIPKRSDLELWAGIWAAGRLIEEGTFDPFLGPVPLPIDNDATTARAILNLASRGIDEPTHPARPLGVVEERSPSDDEVRKWAYRSHRETAGFWRHHLRPIVRRRNVSIQTKAFINDLPQALRKWEEDRRSFTEVLEAECRKVVESDRILRQKHAEKLNEQEQSLLSAFRERRSEQEAALTTIRGVHEAFSNGDSTILTIVLQAAFSDNGGTAAPIGVDNGDLLVVMLVPPVDEAVWPEELKIGQHLSAKTRSKSSQITQYGRFVASHALATAKEAMAISSSIQRVKIVVLDEDEDGELLRRPVLSVVTIDRSQMERFPSSPLANPIVKRGIELMVRWERLLESRDEEAILQQIDEFESHEWRVITEMEASAIHVLESFSEQIEDFVSVPRARRPRFESFAESETNTSDEIQISGDLSDADLELLDLDADEITSPDFWVLAGLLAEQWHADAIELNDMKLHASGIAECLYEVETSVSGIRIRIESGVPVVESAVDGSADSMYEMSKSAAINTQGEGRLEREMRNYKRWGEIGLMIADVLQRRRGAASGGPSRPSVESQPERSSRTHGRRPSAMKACPSCRRSIAAEARRCRFCKKEI